MKIPAVAACWFLLTLVAQAEDGRPESAPLARGVAALDGRLAVEGGVFRDSCGREVEPLFLEAMRPYPRRVAGNLRAICWDGDLRRLTVRYEIRRLVGARGVVPTVIQLRPGVLSRGVKVTVSDPRAEYAVEDGRVLVWAASPGELTVTVSPRTPGRRDRRG